MDNCNATNGNGPLTNPNNGPVIKNANLTAVFMGDWSTSALSKLQNRIMNFIPAFLDSPVHTQLSQYGINKGTLNPLPLAGGSIPSNISSDAIPGYVDQSVNNGTFPRESQPLLFYPPGTNINITNAPLGVEIGAYHDASPNQTAFCVFPFPGQYNNVSDFTENDINSTMNAYGLNCGHEINEMLTDPLENAYQAYNTTTFYGHQEGGDLCGNCGDVSTILTPQGNVPVQGFWSNAKNACWPPPNSCMSGNMTVDCPPSLPSSPSPSPPSSSRSTGETVGIGLGGGIGGALLLGGIGVGIAKAREHPEHWASRALLRNPLSKGISALYNLATARRENPQIQPKDLEQGQEANPPPERTLRATSQNKQPSVGSTAGIGRFAAGAVPPVSRTPLPPLEQTRS